MSAYLSSGMLAENKVEILYIPPWLCWQHKLQATMTVTDLYRTLETGIEEARLREGLMISAWSSPWSSASPPDKISFSIYHILMGDVEKYLTFLALLNSSQLRLRLVLELIDKFNCRLGGSLTEDEDWILSCPSIDCFSTFWEHWMKVILNKAESPYKRNKFLRHLMRNATTV